MDVRKALKMYKDGSLGEEEVLKVLRLDYLLNLGEKMKWDVQRAERRGVPEIVYGEVKSAEEIEGIVRKALQSAEKILVSRISQEKVERINVEAIVDYNPTARMAVYRRKGERPKKTGGKVGLLCGGTADVPVAEEARCTAEEMGCTVYRHYDVGIAALHRVLDAMIDLHEKDVDSIIAVAGMEGTLPSIVSALSTVPVVGVPTGMGYGVAKNGRTAFNTMLSSCSLGLVVVNVDNGVGAGVAAALIANRSAAFRRQSP